MATKQNTGSGLTRPATTSEQNDDAARQAAAAAGQSNPDEPGAQGATGAADATGAGTVDTGSAGATGDQGGADADKKNETKLAVTPKDRAAAKDVNVGDVCKVTNLLDSPLRDFETGEVYEFNVQTETTLTSFLDGQRAAGRIRVEM